MLHILKLDERFQHMVLEHLNIHMQKKKTILIHIFHHICELTQNGSYKKLKINGYRPTCNTPKTIKLLEENIGEILCGLELCKKFLVRTPKA